MPVAQASRPGNDSFEQSQTVCTRTLPSSCLSVVRAWGVVECGGIRPCGAWPDTYPTREFLVRFRPV